MSNTTLTADAVERADNGLDIIEARRALAGDGCEQLAPTVQDIITDLLLAVHMEDDTPSTALSSLMANAQRNAHSIMRQFKLDNFSERRITEICSKHTQGNQR